MKQPLLALALLAVSAAPAAAFDAQRPAVVELFTSQGCSSCPPANANVNALADRPDVLALTYGVQVWDHLGWKDTFAHPAFTNRQRAYQARIGKDYVYTPEVVVEGATYLVGNKRPEIEGAIAQRRARSAKAPSVQLTPAAVVVGAGEAPRAGADVWLVRYDPRTIQVPIRRGENGGRTLPHRNVVRELVKLGPWRGETSRFALPPATAPRPAHRGAGPGARRRHRRRRPRLSRPPLTSCCRASGPSRRA
jgi:hypothetical protein